LEIFETLMKVTHKTSMKLRILTGEITDCATFMSYCELVFKALIRRMFQNFIKRL